MTSEKEISVNEVVVVNRSPSPSTTKVGAAPAISDVDAAWKFLDANRDKTELDQVNMAKLRLKIDWHIVPLMFLCYTMQFLDKVILNVSRVFPPPNTFRSHC